MTQFGDWLYKKRKDRGITQQQLADNSRVSKSYISMLERGTKHPSSGQDVTPSEETVEALAGALFANVNEARLAAGYKASIQEPPGETLLTVYDPKLDIRPAEEKRQRLRDEIRRTMDRLDYLLGCQIEIDNQIHSK